MNALNRKQRWLSVALPLLAVVVLVAHAVHYLPFLSDDALISFRYSRRLLHGHGLTWTAGRPVEGYSNLLWLLLVAFLGAFGVDLVDASRILGILGMATVLVAISAHYLRRRADGASWVAVGIALLFFALAAPTAVWAIGGLEQPLYAALLAVSIALAFSILESPGPDDRRVRSLSLVLGLICVTRPDGPLFAVAAVAAILVARPLPWRQRARDCAIMLAGPALLYGGQLVFRVFYYGELVPNTALVKFAPSGVRLRDGVRYLVDGFWALSPWSAVAVVALVGLLVPRRTRGKGLYLLATGVAWGTYVVVIGGDIFPAFRHLVPLLVVAAFALAEGLSLAFEPFIARPRYAWPLVVLAGLLFVPFIQTQFAHKQSQRAVRERWEWQGKEVGLLLKAAFWKQQPVVAVTAAGCLPFWSELPALDMLGLNDYYLPRHPPPDMGSGFIGHELGDGRYVLDQKPDIIVFTVGSEPSFRSGLQMAATGEFHERYVPVIVRTSPGHDDALIYFDKSSARIGVAALEAGFRVPGFLLTGKDSTAALNRNNKLVLTLAPGGTAQIVFDAGEPSSWTSDVYASDRVGVGSEVSQQGRALRLTIRSTSPRPIEVEDIVVRRGASAAPASR